MTSAEEKREVHARAEVQRKLASQAWRLSNLYWVEDEDGRRVKFRPRWEQRELHNNWHNQNVVLKCRKPGISTYCAIRMLDFSLFCGNKTSGIVDKTDDDSKRKLAIIKFAYENLDAAADPIHPQEGEDTSGIGAMIKASIPLVVDNKKELEWANGSKIWAGSRFQGVTLQFLWVSEFGYISFYNPEGSAEIMQGALNTVSKGNTIIFESTHEGGKFGHFYALTRLAMESADPLGEMDWRFHFFPWWRNLSYTTPCPESYKFAQDDEMYFLRLASKGIKLTRDQRYWYVKKRSTVGDAMLKHFPSVEEECFEAVISGAIYGRLVSSLRANKRVVDFEHDRTAPLYTFWDIGYSDFTAIWLLQMVGRDVCALAYFACCREAPPFYVAKIREWERVYDMPVTLHYLPHDAAAKEKSGQSYQDYLRTAGLANTRVVIRTPDEWLGINHLRSRLPQFYLHKTNCGREWQHEGRTMPSGIGSLEGYHTKEDASTGVIREHPVHDDNSHGASALRTFAEAHMRGLLEGTSAVAGQSLAGAGGRTILAGWNTSREQMGRKLPRATLS